MASTRRAALAAVNQLQQNNGPTKAGQVKRQQNDQQKENDGLANKRRKRNAFGDITNNKETKDAKKGTKKVGKKSTVIMIVPKHKPSNVESSQDEKDQSWQIIELSQGSQSQRSTQSSQSSEEDVSSQNEKNVNLSQEVKESQPEVEEQDWVDVDKDHMKDPFQVALYAYDIFEYYKERELKFMVPDYMPKQTDLSHNMRGILVDWLVEVQENFELNHETLYLAIRLVDAYLSKKTVSRDKLQLVGATSLFISCKFDERCPPVLDDFLYICDDAYRREELIKMEQQILKSIDFDLGLPLSYRFLRRYSKCARSTLITLTLARFILETSQMDYNFIRNRESFQAAAALMLAQKMNNDGSWDSTLEHYTGYTADDLLPQVQAYNTMISAPANDKLATIRTKYSHKVFNSVALISPIKIDDFETTFGKH